MGKKFEPTSKCLNKVFNQFKGVFSGSSEFSSVVLRTVEIFKNACFMNSVEDSPLAEILDKIKDRHILNIFAPVKLKGLFHITYYDLIYQLLHYIKEIDRNHQSNIDMVKLDLESKDFNF